ncbi:UDP-N-acetylglucosamine 1-carboxyvinyltransferase [Coprothermobacter platensis]|uniref:UDP-N-acetylglucosamine 1-carboxyvinyltransferase n=1 Tax=Coprothermobacter platensis TaxID=108819 RepID=UPI000363D82C|nr:UDP-N-acetylglucosamine 1-carboxyvinyltransferase [Coprothermobacter platensis]
MSVLIIDGGVPLRGRVTAQGCKNSALAVLAAAALCEDKVYLTNVPDIGDVRTMISILRSLGYKVTWNSGVTIKPGNTIKNYDLTRTGAGSIRGSLLFLGALLGRLGKVVLPMPGGCNIGTRPIDLHLKGLSLMGAKLDVQGGSIRGEAPDGLKGAYVYLDFPSVGATENIMIAAALANGETTIENAAQDQQVVELGKFLMACGVKVHGLGTKVIRIKGKREIGGVTFRVSGDSIEAGTYIIAAAATRGSITVDGIDVTFLRPLLFKLQEAGIEVVVTNGHEITLHSSPRPRGITIKTMPFPGFPTDLQPLMASLLATADGRSVITETVYDGRMGHVSELWKMGANIEVEGNTAIINGVEKLTGAPVVANNLRAGAALIVAGLSAEGRTAVYGMEHVMRGYSSINQKLKALDARVQLLSDEEAVSIA